MTKLEPDVYAAQLGEDSSELYVPVDRYPTRLGALRAVRRSLWSTEADHVFGREYVDTGDFIDVETHPHGPEDATYDPDTDMATCHPARRRCRIFVAT